MITWLVLKTCPFTDQINILDVELIIVALLALPLMVDNLILTEAIIDLNTVNTSIIDDLDSVVYLINNWVKSVAADEGHHEIGLICIIILWLPLLINILMTINPFINENSECDTLLFFSDVIFMGLGFIFVLLPIFSYYTITSCITWNIPIVFNLFLPAIELIGKLIRAINVTLRLSSNLTAGHLLMLLIGAFSEFLLASAAISLKVVGFLVFNFSIIITTLESCLICIQTYVWSILVLYYINQDE